MSDSQQDAPLNFSFDIKDYIDAAHDAARGTRVVTIVLAVACVLVFIGFWNSYYTSWAHERIRNAYDPDYTPIYKTLDIAKHPKIESISLFGVNDFKNVLSLAKKLTGKTDQLSEYLYGRLKPETLKLLEVSVKNDKPDDKLVLALGADLNEILKNYDEKLFEKVTLNEEMSKLRASHPDGTELIRLNRLLLEDTYKDEIVKSHDVPIEIAKGHYMPISPADAFRRDVQLQTVRAHVENVRLVRAPFFGIAFDVNDLGLIGGIGFIVILLLLRHSLSREIKSLNRSFKEALSHGQLRHFYHVLAIRQVFTVPDMEGETQNRWLALSQKSVSILPALVFSIVVYYDFSSVTIYELYQWETVSGQLLIEFFLLLFILYLSWRCLERLRTIDRIWDGYWKRLTPKKSHVILLDEDLVEKYGRDDVANAALRGL